MVENRRTQWSQMNAPAISALLEASPTSAGKKRTTWEPLRPQKETFGNHFFGSLSVKELDTLLVQHLLEKLEEGKRIRNALPEGMRDGWDELDAMLATYLIDVAKSQEKATAGIASNLKKYQEEAVFTNKLEDIPAVWHTLGIEKQRRFISLVTDKITLTKPAANWLQLEITWFWPDMPHDVLYIWQRKGKGAAWTDEENQQLKLLCIYGACWDRVG